MITVVYTCIIMSQRSKIWGPPMTIQNTGRSLLNHDWLGVILCNATTLHALGNIIMGSLLTNFFLVFSWVILIFFCGIYISYIMLYLLPVKQFVISTKLSQTGGCPLKFNHRILGTEGHPQQAVDS